MNTWRRTVTFSHSHTVLHFALLFLRLLFYPARGVNTRVDSGNVTCLPPSPPVCLTSSTQMKLDGKIRRLLGDEFQEKVSLFTTLSLFHLTAHPPCAFT